MGPSKGSHVQPTVCQHLVVTPVSSGPLLGPLAILARRDSKYKVVTMGREKPKAKKIEGHEPGASRDEVMMAMEKAAKPIKKPEK